ncbi:MAG: lipase [Eubacterium sp.]|nr:lipase [Eubacterium sp.]
MQNTKIIGASDSAFSYMGRIDFSEPDSPLFVYAGSMVSAKFTGTSVGVRLIPRLIYDETQFGVILDGVQYCYQLKRADIPELIYIPVAEGLEDTEHSITVFKRTAGSHCYFNFCGLVLDEGAQLLPDGKEYDLNIEVYGDSVSAGEVVEAVNYTGCSDPQHHSQYDNSWFAYPLSLARKLNARVHDIAQGGIALFDKTGWFNGPDYIGMESVYDKLSYAPPFSPTPWDFSRYTPDIVIIAIGQNDANPDPDCIKRPDYRERWKSAYKKIVLDLQEKYGDKTKFILITTVLMHEKDWDEALDEIRDELADKNVTRYRFTRNGAATPGHPRIPEQEEMACELAAYIRGLYH